MVAVIRPINEENVAGVTDTSWGKWAADPATTVFRQRCDVSLRPRRLLGGSSLAALAITLAFHAWLVVCLRPHAVVSGQEQEDVLELVWIERPSPASAPASLDPKTRRLTSAVHAKPRLGSVSASASVVDATVVTSPVPVVADDAWQALPGQAPSDFRAVEAFAFQHNPLVPRDAAFDPASSSMEAVVQDRSIGAKARKLFKKGVCARFRQELRRSFESTYSLMARLRAEGCEI